MKYKAKLSTACRGREILIPSIIDAKEGFWVTDIWIFTRDDDCKYWIPPGQILIVEKVIDDGADGI